MWFRNKERNRPNETKNMLETQFLFCFVFLLAISLCLPDSLTFPDNFEHFMLSGKLSVLSKIVPLKSQS